MAHDERSRPTSNASNFRNSDRSLELGALSQHSLTRLPTELRHLKDTLDLLSTYISQSVLNYNKSSGSLKLAEQIGVSAATLSFLTLAEYRTVLQAHFSPYIEQIATGRGFLKSTDHFENAAKIILQGSKDAGIAGVFAAVSRDRHSEFYVFTRELKHHLDELLNGSSAAGEKIASMPSVQVKKHSRAELEAMLNEALALIADRNWQAKFRSFFATRLAHDPKPGSNFIRELRLLTSHFSRSDSQDLDSISTINEKLHSICDAIVELSGRRRSRKR